jgi:hypothetical protein
VSNGVDRRRRRAEQEQQDRPIPVPADVFVVCERGIPVAAAVTDQGAREAAAGRSRSDVRIHKIPVVEASR